MTDLPTRRRFVSMDLAAVLIVPKDVSQMSQIAESDELRKLDTVTFLPPAFTKAAQDLTDPIWIEVLGEDEDMAVVVSDSHGPVLGYCSQNSAMRLLLRRPITTIVDDSVLE